MTGRTMDAVTGTPTGTVKVLSYADIRAAGACGDALAEVPQWYPDGFPLSEEALTRLVAHKHEWATWLYREMAPVLAWPAYVQATDPAWDAYRRDVATAVASARADYEKATAPALVAVLVAWGRGDYDTPEDGQ